MNTQQSGSTIRRHPAWLGDLLLVVVSAFILTGTRGLGLAFSADEDSLLFYIPLRHLLSDPLVDWWDPYMFCGFPLDSNPQVQNFYPLNILYMFLPTLLAYGLSLWLHMAIGGGGIAFLLHRLGCSVHGRRMGALIFLFSTFWQAKITNAGMLAGCAWTGFSLGGAVALFEDKDFNPRWLIVSAAGLALSVMGGMPHPPVLIGLGIGFLTLQYLLKGRQFGIRIGARALAVLGLALLLSATTWLPALENMPRTNRGPLTEEGAFAGSLSVMELPAAIFGGLSQHELVRLDPWEGTAVISVMGLVLAVLGIRKNWRRHWAWLAMILFALVISTGPNLYLAKLLREAVPGVDRFNLPNRSLLLATTGLAVFAGLGIDALCSFQNRKPVRVWLLIGACTFVCGILMAFLFPGAWNSLLHPEVTDGVSPFGPFEWQWSLVWNLVWGGLAFVVLALFRMPGLKPSKPMWIVFALTIVVPQLALRPRLFLETVEPGYFKNPATVEWMQDFAPNERFIDYRPSIPSLGQIDIPMLVPHCVHRLPEWYRLFGAWGYDPLYPKWYGRMIYTAGEKGRLGGVERTVRTRIPPTHLLRRFGIRYVIGDPYERTAYLYEVGMAGGKEKIFEFNQTIPIDRFWVRHHLREALGVRQGTEVGVVILQTASGENVELPVRAGVEVANALLANTDPPVSAAHHGLPTIRCYPIPTPDGPMFLQQYPYEWRFHPPLEVTTVKFKGFLNHGSWNVIEMAISSADDDTYKRVFQDDSNEIYRLEDCLKSVTAVNSCFTCDSPEAAVERIASASSDPHELVLLSEDSQDMELPSEPAPASVSLLRRDKDSLRFNVNAQGPALLRIVEGWSPWWKACVDGESAALIRGDLAFMALPVPEGDHEVELVYRPLPMMIAIGLACLGLALCGLLVLLFSRKDPRQSFGPSAPQNGSVPCARDNP